MRQKSCAVIFLKLHFFRNLAISILSGCFLDRQICNLVQLQIFEFWQNFNFSYHPQEKSNLRPKFSGSVHNNNNKQTERILIGYPREPMTDRIQFLYFVNKQTKCKQNEINLSIFYHFHGKKEKKNFTHLCKTRNVSVAEMSENHHVDGVRFYDLP